MRTVVLAMGLMLAIGAAACDTAISRVAGLGVDTVACLPTITPSSVNARVGTPVTFTAAGCGVASTDWRWRSSDLAVATIDSLSGTATVLDTGTTTVTALDAVDTVLAGAAVLHVVP